MKGGSRGWKGFYDVFMACFLRFLWHSPFFEPLEGEIEAHSPGGMVCDEWGMSREELEMPHSPLFGWHSLLFEPRSPFFAPLELGGMRREESFERLEGGGMAHEEVFAQLKEELAAFSLAFRRLEGRGMRREE